MEFVTTPHPSLKVVASPCQQGIKGSEGLKTTLTGHEPSIHGHSSHIK